MEVRILAPIRTLADMRCIIRRDEVVKWLVQDVVRTQDASALGMLHAFTKRIMPEDSKEKPADVFERILQEVMDVRETAEAAWEANTNGTRNRKKKKKKSAKSPTGGPANTMFEAYNEL